MKRAKILIVEDEMIIAGELEARMVALGYDVAGIAASGEEAIQLAFEKRPDLVFMDIVLKGEMDGIQAAGVISKGLSIPIVYLTAYADQSTLERAKVTEPMGYLVKPFSESELRAAVEIALYKHEAETKLREIGQRLTDTLKGMGDGVLTTDLRGRITVMNPAAESLVGCRYEDVVGKDLGEVFKIIHRDTGAPIESPVTRALREGTIVDRGENTLLVTRSGEEIPIDDTAAPVRDDEGNITGVVLVLRDGTERLRSEAWTKQLEAQSLQAEKLESLVTVVGGVAHDLNNTLSDMLGFTQLALEEAEPASTISQNLRQVETLGQQAAEMIRQLLVFSRKWGKNESAAASILGRDLQVAQTNYPGEYRD